MHVVFIGPHPFPNTLGRGGVERINQVLRESLARHVRITLIAPNAKADLHHTDEHGQIIYLKRTRTPGFLTYWSLTSRAILREIHRLAPDIVHIHDAAGFAHLWPASDTVWNRAVFTPQGLWERDIRESPGSSRIQRISAPARAYLTGVVERKSRQRFKDVILVNRYLLDVMADLERMRLYDIANPVDWVYLNAPAPRASNQPPYALLQVGVISPRKNVLGSIRLFQALKTIGTRAHLHILGPATDQSYAEACRAAVAEADLGDDVTFHGEQSPETIAAWMDKAQGLLLLSNQETAPVVVSEAHCRSLPTFVRAAYGLPWMVRDGENGVLLTGGNPEADAQKVAAALTWPWDRAQIREQALSLYHPDAVARQTAAVYREILNRHLGVAAA
jgi:glycosyltransferase involved in cell wall biosynthesis